MKKEYSGLAISLDCPWCQERHIVLVCHNEDVFRCPKTEKHFGVTPKLIASASTVSSKELIENHGILPLPKSFNIKKDVLLQNSLVGDTPSISSESELKGKEDNRLTKENTSKILISGAKKASKFSSLDLPDKFGRYEILEVLGGGGFGIVYKGYDPLLRRYVAIKRSISPLEDSRVEWFQREAEILAQLNHPNIVQVYDFGLNEEQIPYIVMEFVSGKDICDFCTTEKEKKHNSFLRLVGQFFSDLADALHFLHQKHIYHQDIKPGNILVSEDNGRVKILDFGLAISGSSELTHFEGTCRYCAPERFKNNYKPTIFSDIYSLGVVLYEALTGRQAITGEKIPEIIGKLTSGENDIRFEAGEVDETLRKICLKCIAFKVEERYQSAKELHLDLICHVADVTQINDYPYLYLLEQEKSRILFPLTKKKYFIGRSFGNDLVIQDDTISRVHAVIEIDIEEKEVFLTNISQKVPIKVNKEPLLFKETVALNEMDCLNISDYVFFYVPSRRGRELNLLNKGYEETLLSLDQTQMLLLAKEHEIYKMIQNGELKAIRRGDSISINAKSVYEHIERFSGNKLFGFEEASSNEESKPIFQLDVFFEDEKVAQYEFDASIWKVSIGRSSDCDVSIDGVGISRFHCEIERQDWGSYTITDQNSNNGTFVQGEKISSCELNHEDTIILGKHRLHFRDLRAEKLRKKNQDPKMSPGKMTLFVETEQKIQKPKASLIATLENGEQTIKPIVRSALFFGSDPICDYYLKSWGVRFRHLLLLQEEDEFRLINLVSKKGLFLNGQEVHNTLLKDGDCFKFAKYEFKFCLEKETKKS